MKQLNLIVGFFFVLLILNIKYSFSQSKMINSKILEEIKGKWYITNNNHQIPVHESSVTLKFKSNVSESDKNKFFNKLNCSVLSYAVTGFYDIELPKGLNSVDFYDLYTDHPLIDIIEINFPCQLSSIQTDPNDDYFIDQWHLQDETLYGGIDMVKAWEKVEIDPEIIIAVIDDGIDLDHEEFIGNIWINEDEIADNNRDDDRNGYIDDVNGFNFVRWVGDVSHYFLDDYFHGTPVTGVFGAKTNNSVGISGVAGGFSPNPGCKIMVLKSCCDGQAETTGYGNAVLYAVENGAKIISTSIFAESNHVAIEAAFNTAYNEYDCFIAGAAGNYGYYVPNIQFPQSLEYCFAVGASEFKDTASERTYWSAHGDGLMVLAPGKDITTTYPGVDTVIVSGTSLSAPMVAGIAGLIRTYYPNFTNRDVEKVLCLTAEKLPGSTYSITEGYPYGTWSYDDGYGKVNANRALGLKGDITENIFIEKNNYIAEQVSVTNNTSFTISENSTLFFINNGELIVDEGSTLYLENEATLFGFDNLTEVKIYGTVQVNGTMNLENCNLKVYGELYVPGNSIVSCKDNGSIEIIGNVSSGTDASLEITGIGKENKMLFVNNHILLIPTTLSQFSLTNGKIVMDGSSSQIKTLNSATDVYLNNIKLTSSSGTRNNHKGIYLYHTLDATIENCVFEKGYYGLYSERSGSDPVLNINNCTFYNCYFGLRANGRAVIGYNNEFTNNTYGLYARLMDVPSRLDNNEFRNNIYGIYYQGSSTTSLTLYGSTLNNNVIGVKANGRLTVNVECSNIKNNSLYGVYLWGYSSVNLSSSYGTSNLSNNKYAIYAPKGDRFDLYYGYNNLKPNTSISGAKCMYGKFHGLYGNVYCYRNIWKSSGGSPVSGTDYSLTGITLKDYYPRKYFSPCQVPGGPMELLSIADDSFDPTGEALDVRKINTQHFKKQKLNKAVAYVLDLTQSDDADAELNTLLLSEILSHPYKNMNNKEQWYIEYAYNMFKENVGEIDLVNNTTAYKRVIRVQNKLHDEFESENVANKEYKKALFRVGKAHFHHLAGRTDKAISVLDKALSHIEDTALIHFVQEQICYLDAEIAIEDSVLDTEELDAYLEACLTNTVENKSGSINIQEDKEDEENEGIEKGRFEEKGWFENKGIEIYPNPVTGQSQILTYSDSEIGSVVKIYDIAGRIVYEYVLNAGDNIISINNSAYLEGIYQIVLFENGIAVENCKMVISK